MGLDKIFYSALLFALVLIVGISVMVDLDSNIDAVNMSDDTSVDFTTINTKANNITANMNSETLNVKNDTFGTEAGATGTEDSLFKGAFNAIKNFTSIFGFVGSLIESLADSLGIEEFWINLALTLLVMVVSFAIILLIFRIRG